MENWTKQGMAEINDLVLTNEINDKNKEYILQNAIVITGEGNGISLLQQSISHEGCELFYYNLWIEEPKKLVFRFTENCAFFVYNVRGKCIFSRNDFMLELPETSFAIRKFDAGIYDIELQGLEHTFILIKPYPSIEQYFFTKAANSLCYDNTYPITYSQLERIKELQQQTLSGLIWDIRRKVIIMDLLFQSEKIYSTISTPNICRDTKDETMENIRKYIELNCHEKISLYSISQHFSITRNRLKKEFTKYFQHDVASFIRATKMEKARKMLLETELTVEEIAWETGYQTRTPFKRIFNSFWQIDPYELRRKKTNP